MAPPPNYRPGIGRLATDRYDFQAHLDGVNPPGFTDFRHTADETDMNPPVFAGLGTVQLTLEEIAAYISNSSNGEGFITVGDGYDTWYATNGLTSPNPNYYYDPSIPSLDTILNPLFSSITNNIPLPSSYARIQKGGIVVIKAGTYIVQKPIYVPPGIILLGEGYGTKIVNATALNLSSTPPTPQIPIIISNVSNASPMVVTTLNPIPNLKTGDYVSITDVTMSAPLSGSSSVNYTWQVIVTSPTTFSLTGSTTNGTYVSGGAVTTNAPIFIINPDNNRNINDGAVNPNLFIFSRETKIMNMVISDNFVENTVLGDTYYKLPQNKTSSSYKVSQGLIFQELGSNLVLDKVTLMGRVNFSSGTVVSQITESAIQTNFKSNSSTGTILKITDCFIDGFSIPVIFEGSAGGIDYLECSGCKIRAYGYNGGDSSSSFNNTFFETNDNTAKITGNILYANASNVANVVCVINTVASPPSYYARGKLLVSGNDIIINNASRAVADAFIPIQVTENIDSLSEYVSYMSYGNNIQDKFDLGLYRNITNVVSGTLYTIDSSSNQFDYCLLAPGGQTITLPSAVNYIGRTLVIKDTGGASISAPTVINAVSSPQEYIDGQVNYTISTPYTSITLYAGYAGNWFII